MTFTSISSDAHFITSTHMLLRDIIKQAHSTRALNEEVHFITSTHMLLRDIIKQAHSTRALNDDNSEQVQKSQHALAYIIRFLQDI